MKSKISTYFKLACFLGHNFKTSTLNFNNWGSSLFLSALLSLFGGCSRNYPVQPPVDKTVIKGTVTDSLTGQPLPGTVVILNTGLSTTADSSGNYRLVGMGGGTFTLRYEKYDWRRKSEYLTVAANDTLSMDTMKLDSCRWVAVEINLPSPWFSGLMDVCFVDSLNGWAVGSDEPRGYPGYIIHTTDGGYTWEMQFGAMPLDAWYFHKIDFVDDFNGWAVADDNQMKRTTDGGTTWLDIVKPYTGPCYAMDFVDRNTGWIAQYGDGSIYKTIDGGNSWNKLIVLPDSGLCNIKFVDLNKGWLRSSNKIYNSIDGGQTWTLSLEKIYSGSGEHSEMSVVPPGNIWIEGYKSLDGGLNWLSQPSDTFGAVIAISFCNNNYGWMAAINGPYSFFIHTINGGQTWGKIEPPGDYYYIFAIQFLTPYCGWALAGNEVLVYK